MSPSCLLKHTLSICRLTVQIQTYSSTHSLMTASTTVVVGKVDPQFPEGRETKRQRKISRPSDVCVIYTPTFSFFCLWSSFSSVLSCKFSSLSASLAVLWVIANIPPILNCFVLCSTHCPYTCAYTSHLQNDAGKLFAMSYKLKKSRDSKTYSVWSVSPSAC